jgi:hypothetical protein
MRAAITVLISDQDLRLRIQRSACRVVNSGSAAGPVGRGDAPLARGHGCDVTQVRTTLYIRAQSAAARNGSSFATDGIPLAPPPWSAYGPRNLSEAGPTGVGRGHTAAHDPNGEFSETFGFLTGGRAVSSDDALRRPATRLQREA